MPFGAGFLVAVTVIFILLCLAIVVVLKVKSPDGKESTFSEPIDPNEKRIYFKWNGKKYSVPKTVFVQGRYVVLPDRTVLRIRAWLLNSDIIPTDIVVVTERRARTNAVPAVEEPDDQS